jgi:class 3 adenylate cyclase/tetratricopeptide (TPR) repeat protein
VVDEADSASIDELLDRAVRASNSGDRAAAAELAERVLAADRGNPEAEDLLASVDKNGEIRRLTLMFVDLVDSTVLSRRVEPETYRTLVGSFRDQVVRLVESYEGHLLSTKGDGLMAAFGHPTAHEDDVQRAVSASLDITRMVDGLSRQADHRFGVTVNVRVGIHRGVVYVDPDADDVYGFTANFASRVSTLAEPGTVAVSDAINRLVGDAFDLEACPPASVKGVDGPVSYHRVVAERTPTWPSPSRPLVGRAEERAGLERIWQDIATGEATGSGVAFVGEAGIGKTRMVREAADMVEESGGVVVELRGSPLHAGTGLHPVRRLLERRCGITRLTGGGDRLRLLRDELLARRMDPAAVLPLLAPVLGVGPEHGYRTAVVEGRTLYDLIRTAAQQYLVACLGDRPGLIIAEDMHWFDPTTIELVDTMLRSSDRRHLLVLTGRDDSWLQDDWPITTFELKPLTTAESDALITELAPRATAAQRAVVRRRCDGVPFYIEHVVAELDSTEDELQVPDRLYEPLLARLHTRADTLPIVEAAAVIGRSGDIALLSSAVGTGDRVGDVVAELIRARVFETSGGDHWRFRHELQREVAAELAPPSRRREIHARVAGALVDAAAGAEPDWHVVADHYERALRPDDAVSAHLRASASARHRGALQEALSCLTNALTQLAHCAPGHTRDAKEIPIRLERGFLASAALGGITGEGSVDFERCLELASTGEHDDQLFTILTALIGHYVPRAELRRARDLLGSLSKRVTQDRPWSHPAFSSSLGCVMWLQGEMPAARTHLDRALADRSAANPRQLDAEWWVATDPISAAHNYLSLTHVLCGEFEDALDELAQSASRCDALGYPQNVFNRAMAYFVEVWVHMEAGRLDTAATLVTGLRRLSEESGLDSWRFVGATQHAVVKALTALDAGADAATLVARAENIAARVDASRFIHLNVFLTFHDTVISRLLIAAGEPERARERLEKALRHSTKSGMHFQDAELLRLRAHTHAQRGARRTALDEALEVARTQGATLFELRCLLDYFDLDCGGDPAELAAASLPFRGGADWPEGQRAAHILADRA